VTLPEFVRREAALPPYPGACCRMVDKWIVETCGFSALARFGRDFHTDDDVMRWLAEPGGIAIAVNRVMRSAGFAKTREPVAGDVGLIVVSRRLVMAICAGGNWVGRDENGMICAPRDAFWKAWKIT
jgi:hypothetical protein